MRNSTYPIVNVVCSLLLTVAISSCALIGGKQVGKLYTTKTGVKYVLEAKGNGAKPIAGDKIKIHFVGKVVNGEKFASSRDLGRPIVFTLGRGQVIKGWDLAFQELHVGDQARLEIPASLAYGESGLGKVPPNKDLVYYVELLEIVDPPVPYETANRDTFKLESGLQYIISESSTGKMAESFRNVTVDYTGYLSDGNIFDSSVDRGFPFSFELGKGQVIAGWEEGILHMREGEKFRFIVPPSLAYGQRGLSPLIPGGATLIYDVELKRID